MNDYVVSSGDLAFAQQKWDSVWRAYQFLLSTYDEQGGGGFREILASATDGWKAAPCCRCILSFIRAVWARRHCGALQSGKSGRQGGREQEARRGFSHISSSW